MKRIVPGIHSVAEVFKVRPKSITELWLREGDLHGELLEFHNEARKHKVKIRRSSQQGLDREVGSHQGVIAHVDGSPAWPTGREFNQMPDAMIFALDELEDPHNVGSLMRTGWNLGIKGVMTTQDRSAGLAPSAQKVATGAFEHIPILAVANLHSELNTLKDLGFWIYGLSEHESECIYDVKFAAKSVFVIGAEESGLRKPVLSACDVLVGIPQSPGSNSFNAAVAGAIAGFEFSRQRNLSKNPENSRKKL